MSFREVAAWLVVALVCMVGNLAGGYWLGRDFFGHDSDTPFATRLIAHACATALIFVAFLLAVWFG